MLLWLVIAHFHPVIIKELTGQMPKCPNLQKERKAIQTERKLYILNHRQGFNCDKSRPCQESDNERIK